MTLQHPIQATSARLKQALAAIVRALSEPAPAEVDALGHSDAELVFHVVSRRPADDGRERPDARNKGDEHDEV